MKERWLDDLKKKMEGYKETSPEHLWNAIDQELFSKKEAKIIPLLSELNGKSKEEKRFKKRQKRKQIIRVAASVVVLITAVLHFIQTTNKQQSYIQLLQILRYSLKKNCLRQVNMSSSILHRNLLLRKQYRKKRCHYKQIKDRINTLFSISR
ncbi:hypothetical protein QW060_24660 [Myroides ceti]|uniref:Anti-sigma factor n=1 Tax=Paenimyroides ceti TaxID=395087 RepID=A0ABT8CZX6_9FLAO|nr:hypothetical protein [Paenimyroides ceti]MDN3710089.1 hypothetical protein [Paenimyroides ceti]